MVSTEDIESLLTTAKEEAEKSKKVEELVTVAAAIRLYLRAKAEAKGKVEPKGKVNTFSGTW